MFVNLSRQIYLYLAGKWSERFDETLEVLRAAVLRINSTRVDLSLTEGLSSWISDFQRWATFLMHRPT
jgi:MAD (mothers against decapentaplegic) family protein 1